MKTGKLRPQAKVIDHWQVLHEYEVTGSAITTYSITGVSGDVDEEYKLLCRFVGGSATASGYLLRLNNDSASNYGFQRLYGTSSTIGASRETATGLRLTLIGEVAENNVSLSDSLLYAKSGYVRTFIRSVADSISGTTVDVTELSGESWDNSTAPVTAMTIVADQTNGIGIGSKFILYRKVR